ncbi:putative nuclease HARBI1 isoform X2 [Cephus cinctus]|uniref:Nuclease HARBI1 isoform X2 n=1 Tax=Cephus cinctus TaxID=211228 RepID=A0AAJ7BIJ9_CEPCN|nr:putative nuclease HARBI1 isoform X2 [Cephus cinctus]
MSTTSAHRIASRVTNVLARLRPRFVKRSSTNEEIRQQQEQFYRIARFPKIIGCIDCTYCHVKSFGREEAELFRYRKGYLSINVQAVSNANMEITDIVARWQGSVHDSTIFNNSRLCETFKQGHYGDAIC